MKYGKILSAFSITLIWLLPGCAGMGGSSSVQRELDILKMEVADLKDQARLSDTRGGGSAGGIHMDVVNLKTDVQRLTENIETATMSGLTLRQQLEYMSARLDRLEKKADLPPLDTLVVSSVTVPVVAAGAPVIPGPASGQDGLIPPPPPPSYQSQTGNPYESNPAAAAASAPPPVSQTAYDEGKNLYDQKNYGGAVSRFRDQLAADPKGTQAPEAQFYIGESLYAMNQYEEAILEYQKVIQNFPKSTQVPTSLLKQGLSFQAIGDTKSAKLLYQKVVRDHPKSYAAGVAKERLKTI